MSNQITTLQDTNFVAEVSFVSVSRETDVTTYLPIDLASVTYFEINDNLIDFGLTGNITFPNWGQLLSKLPGTNLAGGSDKNIANTEQYITIKLLDADIDSLEQGYEFLASAKSGSSLLADAVDVKQTLNFEENLTSLLKKISWDVFKEFNPDIAPSHVTDEALDDAMMRGGKFPGSRTIPEAILSILTVATKERAEFSKEVAQKNNFLPNSVGAPLSGASIPSGGGLALSREIGQVNIDSFQGDTYSQSKSLYGIVQSLYNHLIYYKTAPTESGQTLQRGFSRNGILGMGTPGPPQIGPEIPPGEWFDPGIGRVQGWYNPGPGIPFNPRTSIDGTHFSLPLLKTQGAFDDFDVSTAAKAEIVDEDETRTEVLQQVGRNFVRAAKAVVSLGGSEIEEEEEEEDEEPDPHSVNHRKIVLGELLTDRHLKFIDVYKAGNVDDGKDKNQKGTKNYADVYMEEFTISPDHTPGRNSSIHNAVEIYDLVQPDINSLRQTTWGTYERNISTPDKTEITPSEFNELANDFEINILGGHRSNIPSIPYSEARLFKIKSISQQIPERVIDANLRNIIYKSFIFLNETIILNVKGKLYRKPGKFITIKGDMCPSLAQEIWFVIEVKHKFENGSYRNVIKAVRFLADGKPNDRTLLRNSFMERISPDANESWQDKETEEERLQRERGELFDDLKEKGKGLFDWFEDKLDGAKDYGKEKWDDLKDGLRERREQRELWEQRKKEIDGRGDFYPPVVRDNKDYSSPPSTSNNDDSGIA